MILTTQHEGRWAIRSMLCIRRDLEAMQIAVESADITAAVLHLPDRSILIVRYTSHQQTLGHSNKRSNAYDNSLRTPVVRKAPDLM